MGDLISMRRITYPLSVFMAAVMWWHCVTSPTLYYVH